MPRRLILHGYLIQASAFRHETPLKATTGARISIFALVVRSTHYPGKRKSKEKQKKLRKLLYYAKFVA